MKKAKGISINVIIVAAIALVVLVVLLVVFTGRMGIWGQGLTDATKQNACTDSVENDGPGGRWDQVCGFGEVEVFGTFTDSNTHAGEKCCVQG